jgi:hypothetical protein
MLGRQTNSQSPGRRHRGDWPARSHLAADTKKTDEPARCGWSFAGIHRVRPALEIRPFSGPTTPHRLPHTLPACSSVYSSDSNTYYRNLRGCLSVLPELTSHIGNPHKEWRLRTTHHQRRYPEWPCGFRRSGLSGQPCSSPKQGTVYLGWHQQRADQVLLCDLTAGIPVRHGSRGHHHLSAGTRPLLHAEDRAGEAAVPFKSNASANFLRWRRWLAASRPSFADTSGASPQTCQTTSYAASGLAGYHPIYGRFLLASPKATWTPRPASLKSHLSRRLRPLPHFLTAAFVQRIEDLSRQVASLSAHNSKS